MSHDPFVIDLQPVLDHGACDRLRRLTFYVTIARLRSRHSVLLHEPLSSSCPFRLADYLAIEGIAFAPTDSVPAQPLLSEASPYPDLRSVNDNMPADLGVTAEQFLEEWIATYARIRPSREVQDAIVLAGISRSTIGVHVRRTDKVRARPGRHERTSGEQRREERSMDRMTRGRIARGGIRNAFVASDSEEGKREWTERLRVMGLPVLEHRTFFDGAQFRHTSGFDYFVDLFALSQCGALVVGRTSGVGLAARYIGGISDVTRPPRPRLPESVRQVQIGFFALARRLAGRTFGVR